MALVEGTAVGRYPSVTCVHYDIADLFMYGLQFSIGGQGLFADCVRSLLGRLLGACLGNISADINSEVNCSIIKL